MRPIGHPFVAALVLLSTACVDSIAVGVERAQVTKPPDAGEPDAGSGGDAGTPPSATCSEGVCSEARPGDVLCEDGSTASSACVAVGTGRCAWKLDECPSVDGGVGACDPVECQGPLLVLATNENKLGDCSDGTKPLCLRDDTGACSFQCAPETACGTTRGQSCDEASYCAYTVGRCGANSATGGICQKKPQACTSELASVCGCNGKTYDNECLAALDGASVAFAGGCDAGPALCGDCAGDAPSAPTATCDDGVHKSGPLCVKASDKTCTWLTLACPAAGPCGAETNALLPGACFSPKDCADGETCEGAILCPCGAVCFAANRPGMCRP